MYQSRTDEFVPLFAAFLQGLREAGYVEGQNIAIEWQDARGSHARLPALAAELVRLKVEAIFAVGPQALREAKNTTGALPIVAIDLESDAVEAGYVTSLARPGGNVTGVFLDLPELMGKWLELVKEVTPVSNISVGALWDPTTATPQVKAIEAAAKSMAYGSGCFRFGSRRISTRPSELPIEHLAVQDPRVPRLRSVPSVGPVTAAAFLAAIDDVGRFHHAHQLEAYLGLVPREYSSGDTQRRGPITKAGHARPRWLLIQAALSILRRRPPAAEALWTWALRIAARRGKHVAVVALARRLAGILYALLRDGTVYAPRRAAALPDPVAALHA